MTTPTRSKSIAIPVEVIDKYAQKLGSIGLAAYVIFKRQGAFKLATIQAKLGISKNTAIKAKRRLVEAGLIDLSKDQAPRERQYYYVSNPNPRPIAILISQQEVHSLFSYIYSTLILHTRYREDVKKMVSKRTNKIVNTLPTPEEAAGVLLKGKLKNMLEGMLVVGITPEKGKEMAEWWLREKKGQPFRWWDFCSRKTVNQFLKTRCPEKKNLQNLELT